MTLETLLDNDVFFSALVTGRPNHKAARSWLDAAKPKGWGIAIETYLSAVRLLMNPAVMGDGALTAEKAMDAVEMEIAGKHPGKIVFAKEKPDRAIMNRARGHRQVMDFWLVQLARQEKCKLATSDGGTLTNWAENTVRV